MIVKGPPNLHCLHCNNWLRSEERHATKSFHCCASLSAVSPSFFVSSLLPVTVDPLSVNMLLIWNDWSFFVRLRGLFWLTHQFDGLLENSGDHTVQFQTNLGHLEFESILIWHTLKPFWNGPKAKALFARTFVIFGMHISYQDFWQVCSGTISGFLKHPLQCDSLLFVDHV